MHDLTVADTIIRRDSAGRYCLNDLHQAAQTAGYNVYSKRPQKFFRSPAIAELVGELEREAESANPDWVSTLPVEAIENGPYAQRGTWVVKELVYAYAMWISPAFHLRVIRAYDALVTGQFAVRDAALDQVNEALERLRQARTQAETYWFARRPRWPAIRRQVLGGATYAATARALRLSPASVRNAVNRMIACGLLEPRALAGAQRGRTMHAAIRRMRGWGRQLPLALEVSNG